MAILIKLVRFANWKISNKGVEFKKVIISQIWGAANNLT